MSPPVRAPIVVSLVPLRASPKSAFVTVELIFEADGLVLVTCAADDLANDVRERRPGRDNRYLLPSVS